LSASASLAEEAHFYQLMRRATRIPAESRGVVGF